MNGIHVGFICSFQSQKLQVEEAVATMSLDVRVSTRLGIMEEAIAPGRDLQDQGADVLIAWDTTASLLRPLLAIPVIGIPVRDLDIMRAVAQARKFGSRICILIPEPFTGMELLEELYHVEIRQIPFKNTNDVKGGLLSAFNEGYEVVIGKSYNAINLAEQYNKRAVLIALKKEMIVSSIRQAVETAETRRREREEYIRLQATFKSLSEGVLRIDTDGNVTLINKALEKMFGIEEASCSGRPVLDVLPQNRITEALRKGRRIESDFIDFGGSSIVATHEPIFSDKNLIGVVSIFRTASEIQKIDHRIRSAAVSKGFTTKYSFDTFTVKSSAMKDLIEQAKVFARTDSTILIMGETGTGKEVMAQSIHQFSPRASHPFVAINCSAISKNLLESEVFGYEEGAFTGARKGGKMGLFELAHQGTVFLDEIGSMPLDLQTGLLRVLQEKKVMRIGGERLVPIDVRIIAATNRDLLQQVRETLFREDLFYRLNVLMLRMPPLRQRTADLPDLIARFVAAFCRKYGNKDKVVLPKEVIKFLVNHAWPGNVRELENIMERLVLLRSVHRSTRDLVRSLLLTHGPVDTSGENDGRGLNECSVQTDSEAGSTSVRGLRRTAIVGALQKSNFNISRTAISLGISRSTVYRKMKQFGLFQGVVQGRE